MYLPAQDTLFFLALDTFFFFNERECKPGRGAKGTERENLKQAHAQCGAQHGLDLRTLRS